MPTTSSLRPASPRASKRDELLLRHIGLVFHVAQQVAMRRDGVEVDDLVGAGTLGLIDALEHFDESRGLAFSTYAAPRIRGAMLDELRRTDRVPRSVRRKTRQIDDVMAALARTLGREPGHAELADGLGIDLPTLWRWQSEREATYVVRLEQVAAAPAGAQAAEALGGRATAEALDEELTQRQEAAFLRDALLELPEQERTVLALYYFDELKLADIARVLGVTESRVSQIRSKAIERLRRKLGKLR